MSRESDTIRPELGRLQRWMQEVIVHPGTVEQAIASPAAVSMVPAERVGEVVLPSHTMDPTERVGVYHGMYLMRMEEALSTDYPVIRYHLGLALHKKGNMESARIELEKALSLNDKFDGADEARKLLEEI